MCCNTNYRCASIWLVSIQIYDRSDFLQMSLLNCGCAVRLWDCNGAKMRRLTRKNFSRNNSLSFSVNCFVRRFGIVKLSFLLSFFTATNHSTVKIQTFVKILENLLRNWMHHSLEDCSTICFFFFFITSLDFELFSNILQILRGGFSLQTLRKKFF